MRVYTAESEEALRARSLLKDWADEGYLSKTQHERMEQEIVCELRRTNIFLRLVLFLFTVIIVAAGTGLFFVVIFSRSSQRGTGVFLLFCAVVLYACAEFAVMQAKLYRYGIEEALALCSIAFLCVGVAATFGGLSFFSNSLATEFLVAATGALASLWVWSRFGFAYAFLAAIIFVVWLPGYWTSSGPAHHVIVAALYAAGLITVVAVRPRHRFTYLDNDYSIVESLLWFGIYVAVNLQLSSVDVIGHWLRGGQSAAEFPKTFYWVTWVLIWCVPPAVLARGVHQKDRFVIAVGAVVAILTLVTNKPYLGGQRHTWDPMLLGALLIGVALFLRRWLAGGESSVRHGFTAQRLSGKDKLLMSAAAAGLGFVSPNSISVNTKAASSGPQFGGGDSGGGGASSNF